MLKVKVWDCDKSCDNGWAHHLLLLVGVSLPDDFLPPQFSNISRCSLEQFNRDLTKY